MAEREGATENGGGTDSTNTESTKKPAAEDELEPTETEKPKKKLILKPEDRINLGKQLEPLLKPALKSLVQQLDDVDNGKDKSSNITKVEGETATIRVISYSCVPTIEQLAETITDEKELVISRRVNKEKADKAKKEADKAKEARQKQLVGYEASAARLTASFHRKTNTHLLASKYFGAEHGWLIFLPIQLIVAAIAIIAFVASYYEIKDRKGLATTLTIVAGILGIVAGFLNALDRHLDWRTLHLQHQKSASLYSKLKWDIIMDKIESATSDEEANLNLKDYKEKLKQLEEHNGDLLVPIEIINCFDAIEDEIKQKIAGINRRAKAKYEKEKAASKEAAKANGVPPAKKLQDRATSTQGKILAEKSIDGFVDEKTMYEILGRCYGFVTREVIRPRSCFRLPFSYKLPAPHVVVKQLKYDKQYGNVCKFLDEYDKETQQEEDNNETGLRGESTIDPQEGCCCPRKPPPGAPPSADNV